MAKQSRGSIGDSIRAAVNGCVTNKPWHLRLDAAVLDELKEIRSEWQTGKLLIGGRALATAISQRLREDNLSAIGMNGVLSWLKRKD